MECQRQEGAEAVWGLTETETGAKEPGITPRWLGNGTANPFAISPVIEALGLGIPGLEGLRSTGLRNGFKRRQSVSTSGSRRQYKIRMSII